MSASPTDPKNRYTYFNLSTGETVDLTDAEAPTASNWDIAFKRASIKLNGGISGTKGVAGFFTGNNAEGYDADGKPIRAWFEQVTAESEWPDFTSVTSAQVPADSEFKADRLVPAITGDGTAAGWWLYNAETHAVSAVPENWWIVRSAEGKSYAKFHVTSLVRDEAAGLRRISLGWFYQGAGDTAFGKTLHHYLIEIPLGGGAKYFDFDTQTDQADPSGLTGWDMKVEYEEAAREYRITLNGGISGTVQAAAFGPTATPEAYASGASPTPVPHYT